MATGSLILLTLPARAKVSSCSTSCWLRFNRSASLSKPTAMVSSCGSRCSRCSCNDVAVSGERNSWAASAIKRCCRSIWVLASANKRFSDATNGSNSVGRLALPKGAKSLSCRALISWCNSLTGLNIRHIIKGNSRVNSAIANVNGKKDCQALDWAKSSRNSVRWRTIMARWISSLTPKLLSRYTRQVWSSIRWVLIPSGIVASDASVICAWSFLCLCLSCLSDLAGRLASSLTVPFSCANPVKAITSTLISPSSSSVLKWISVVVTSTVAMSAWLSALVSSVCSSTAAILFKVSSWKSFTSL